MRATHRVRFGAFRLAVVIAMVAAVLVMASPAAHAVTSAGGVSIASGIGNGAISGRVTAAGGAGLAGIEMEVAKWETDGPGGESDWYWYGEGFLTGPDGTYTIGGLDAGVWKVAFRDFTLKYSASEVTSITVTDPGTKSGVDVTMQLAGSISGTVKDTAGKPIAGARVDAFDAARYPDGCVSSLTDAQGRYRIPGTDGWNSLGAKVVVAATHDGHLARFSPAAPTREQAAVIPFAPGQDLTGKDVTLPADTASNLAAPVRMNAATSQKQALRGMPRVGGDHAAWLSEVDGIGMVTLSSGARSRLTTYASSFDINDTYLFADGRVFDAATGAFLRKLEVTGTPMQVSCDDEYAAFLCVRQSNILWTDDIFLTVVDLRDWSSKSVKLGTDVEAYLSPGAVDGGQVAVNMDGYAAVYTFATNQVQKVDNGGSWETVMFDGKIVYPSGWSIYARTPGTTDLSLVYSGTRSVGGLVSDGAGLVFSELDFDAMNGGVSNVEVKRVDLTTKAVKTLYASTAFDPPVAVSSDSYDLSGNVLVRLDGFVDAFWAPYATRILRTDVETLETARLDAAQTSPAFVWGPATSAGRMAWIDDRTGMDRLYFKETTSGPESVVATDASPWMVPVLTPKHLVYLAGGDDGPMSLRSYDIATHATATLLTDMDWEPVAQAQGEKLYYSTIDWETDSMLLKEVDLDTGATVQLAKNPFNEYSPSYGMPFVVGGGKLVYEDGVGVQHMIDTATRVSVVSPHKLPFDDRGFAFEYPRVLQLSPGSRDFENSDTARGTLVCYDFSTDTTSVLAGYVSSPDFLPMAISDGIGVAGTSVYDLGGLSRMRFSPPKGLYLDSLAAADGTLLFTTWPAEGVETTPGIYRLALPGVTAPKVNKAAFSNPVAYELKSLLSTQFSFNSDKANVKAKLVLKTATGNVTIFDASVPNKPGTDYKLPAWDGKVGGKQLPSAAYDWTLTLTKDGLTTTKTGKVTISKIIFALNGSSKASVAATHTPYMVPGFANCYVSATTTASADTLTFKVAGPNGYYLPSRFWGFGKASPLNVTSYVNGTSAFKYRGLHTWTVTGKTNVTYKMTVIQ